MSDDIDRLDMERIEQGGSVAGKRIEMKIGERLRRFAEADLVGNDDAVAVGGERLDRRLPIARGEVAAMQEERRAPVRITLWRHVHIGHVEPLAALRDHEHVYRVRVGEAFKPNAERLFG